MKHFPLVGTLPMLALVSMTACVDNKYDLSDIDTTSEIKVKDLVIPVNLDVVRLGNIISIKEGSELNEVTINGESFYAVNKSGKFESDPIHIPDFYADVPTVPTAEFSFTVPSTSVTNEVSIPYVGQPISSHLDYEATDIDDAIVEITDIYTKDDIKIDISITGNIPADDNVSIHDITLTLPKGLKVMPDPRFEYFPSTGELKVPSVGFDTQENSKISLVALGIENLTENGYGITSDHSMNISEELLFTPGRLLIKNPSAVPSRLNFTVNYNFSKLVVNEVSGVINYKLDGMSIDPVEISGIPDFLAGEETNLVLANPQIYLSINNPVDNYGLKYDSGISITRVYEDGETGTPLTLDNGIFTVSASPEGISHNFCFSPDDPKLVPNEFVNDLNHVPFTSLSNIIAGKDGDDAVGKGIPKTLEINLINPQIPTQNVEHFILDWDIPAVIGKWEILAPLGLKGGSDSKIIYTDRKTGWNDEDVDAINIQHLSLSMVADSDLPLNAILSGSPLGLDGKPITGVKVSEVELKGMTQNQEVNLIIEGDIRHLDGFEFTATVNSASNEDLSPDQTLTLKNIRAKVSGSYIKKF